jgi:hypothetical protein
LRRAASEEVIDIDGLVRAVEITYPEMHDACGYPFAIIGWALNVIR